METIKLEAEYIVYPYCKVFQDTETIHTPGASYLAKLGTLLRNIIPSKAAGFEVFRTFLWVKVPVAIFLPLYPDPYGQVNSRLLHRVQQYNSHQE